MSKRSSFKRKIKKKNSQSKEKDFVLKIVLYYFETSLQVGNENSQKLIKKSTTTNFNILYSRRCFPFFPQTKTCSRLFALQRERLAQTNHNIFKFFSSHKQLFLPLCTIIYSTLINQHGLFGLFIFFRLPFFFDIHHSLQIIFSVFENSFQNIVLRFSFFYCTLIKTLVFLSSNPVFCVYIAMYIYRHSLYNLTMIKSLEKIVVGGDSLVLQTRGQFWCSL